MSIRKINSYLKENNIQILDYWIDQSFRIHYLRTFHVLSCSFFFLNVHFYDLKLETNDLYYHKVFYISKVGDYKEDYSEEMILFFEKIENSFPQYSSSILFQYYNYMIENRKKIYKIIPYQTSDTFPYLSVYYSTDLQSIYDDKQSVEYSIWNFPQDIHHFIQNINQSIDDTIDGDYISILNSIHCLYDKVSSLSSSILKLKELWVNVHRFHIELTLHIRKLEDYSDVYSVHETNLKIQKKSELKEKIKKVIELKTKIKTNIISFYEKFSHVQIIFLYYSLELKKKLISLDTLLTHLKKEL